MGVRYNIDTEEVRGMDRIGPLNRNERKAERMARISEQLSVSIPPPEN